MNNLVDTKQCTKCKEYKPATSEYFHRAKLGRYGLDSVCKPCKAQYTANNRERLSQYKREWYAANKERTKERQSQTARVWREANKERHAQNARAWSEANKNRRAQTNHTWLEANKGRQDYKERKAMHERNRRALKRGGKGTHTYSDIKRQYQAQKGKCYYCKCNVGDNYHVDHVVPLSRGGSNGPENLVIACLTCNQAKYNKLPHEWARGGRLL